MKKTHLHIVDKVNPGSIAEELEIEKGDALLKINGEVIETGLRKFGSIICDHVEVGCNSVLCPGTVILSGSNIYPLTRVRGLIEGNVIVKDMKNIVEKEDR